MHLGFSWFAKTIALPNFTTLFRIYASVEKDSVITLGSKESVYTRPVTDYRNGWWYINGFSSAHFRLRSLIHITAIKVGWPEISKDHMV